MLEKRRALRMALMTPWARLEDVETFLARIEVAVGQDSWLAPDGTPGDS